MAGLRKVMKLFLSGKKFETGSKDSPNDARVKAILDKAALGELFTTYQISQMAKCHVASLRHSCPTFANYAHLVGQKKFWGRPATIKQLRKELGAK